MTKDTSLVYVPLNASQKIVKLKWEDSKLLILNGPAGTGKTTAAIAHALLDIKQNKARKVILCRPTVTVEEKLGFLPGDLDEKLGPWMGPFHDVLGDLSHAKLQDYPVELWPVGLLRGRTLKNCTLVVDEAQNLTFSQLKCIVTRIGKNSRVVLCGDPEQSDLFVAPNPLDVISNKLKKVEGCYVLYFDKKDQVREQFVNDVIEALKD